jgi:integrase
MECDLTPDEFRGIYNNLFSLSDGWADLWLTLYITGMPPGRLLKIKYEDVLEGYVYLKGSCRFKNQRIKASSRLSKLIELRAKRYPKDIYIFQSHSNFNKLTPSPLTLIAFNRALKIAAKKVTPKTVSSKSAYIKQRV